MWRDEGGERPYSLDLMDSKRDIRASTIVSIIMVAAALLIHMDKNHVGIMRPRRRLKIKATVIKTNSKIIL